MKKIFLLILFLGLLVFIIGCAEEIEKPIEKTEQKQQIANPASVYCEEQGGKLDIRTNAEGSQTSYCVAPDGTECEKWAFYSRECGYEEKTISKTISTTPVDSLSDEIINKWDADCKHKNSDLEKANCLLDWQEKNIFWCYTHPEETVMPKMFEAGYPDCVVDMQFQQMKPGSFPVSKIMELKIRNKKIFGACYTYATTYCTLARWNGLTCRVMEVKIIIPQTYSASKGDYGIGYCGAAQKSYLDKLGLGCDEWRKLDWTIDYDHYWAEVLVNGSWQIMERPTWAYKHDTQKYIIDAGRNYSDIGW